MERSSVANDTVACSSSTSTPAHAWERILVVSADPDERGRLQEVLEPFATTVARATFIDALEEAEQHVYDVVFTDLDLDARKTGIELLKAFRTRREYEDVPVVVSTRGTRPGLTGRLRELGFAACLTQPFDESAVSDAVAQATRSPEAATREDADVAVDFLPTVPAWCATLEPLLSEVEREGDVRDLCHVLEAAPAAADSLLPSGESVLDDPSDQVGDMQYGLVMLGYQRAAAMVFGRTLVDTFRVRLESDEARTLQARLLMRGLVTASVARHMALVLEIAPPEQAFFAGFFSVAGRLTLLAHAPDGYVDLWKVDDDELLAPSVGIELVHGGYDHLELGAIMAARWGMPADVVAALRGMDVARRMHGSEATLLTVLLECSQVGAVHILDQDAGLIASTRAMRPLALHIDASVTEVGRELQQSAGRHLDYAYVVSLL